MDSKSDFVKRYLGGDCQAVRDALKSIDVTASLETLTIATAVADEFVSRSIENLSRLYEALLALDYEFADPGNAFTLHPLPNESAIDAFERQMGNVPLLAYRWYRRIKSVNFCQSFQQQTDRNSPLAGLGWAVPFIVESLDRAREHWDEHCQRWREDKESCEETGHPCRNPEPPTLLTGGSASNNDCMGFVLPSYRFDDVLYNDGGGDTYFGDEIARGFLLGGFPALSASKSTLKLIRSLYGEPDREYLANRLPKNLLVV